MNFIESIFDSISIGLKRYSGEFPNEIKSFCIGSGSSFNIHQYISYDMALTIYKDYKKHLDLGTRTSKTENGEFILECFNTMESTTGYTYCFMFPIEEVVIHNPNDIIDEWIKRDKEHKEFMKELLETFYKKKEKKKNEISSK